MNDARESALGLVVRFGWSVFRLEIEHDENLCNGGEASCKSIDHRVRKIVSNDPGVVAGWDWEGYNAYGIDCGLSGLVVVDQDPGAVWPFNGTRVHGTGRGKHYLYEDMIGLGNRARLAPWGVDVRGVGGYIVGPGSWHPHGEYDVEKDVDPGDELPAEFVAACTRPVAGIEDGHGSVVAIDALDAYERLLRIYDQMSRAEVGERNDTLNRLAYTAGGIWARVDEDEQVGELDEDRIKARLLESVPDDGDEAKSRGTIESGWRSGVAKPLPDRDVSLIKVGFFERTDRLAHIWRASMAQMVNPEGVLVALLARIICEIPPDVRLPAVIGSEASLNLGVGLVSDSGGGKSATISVSRKLLGLVGADQQLVIEKPFGSGEGMAQTFLTRGEDREQVMVFDPRRMFICDEIETVVNQAGRQGSTILSNWRSSLTGDQLGQTNADPTKNRCVPAGSYRLVSLVGVQVARSGKLLSADETAVGTPQRMVWADADVDNIEWPEEMPDYPGELNWTMPELPELIDYPEDVKEQIRESRKTKKGRERGHSTLVRLKVATALAVLHEETFISHRWWDLADEIVERSHAIERMCRAATTNIQQQGANHEAKMKRRAEHAADEDSIEKGVDDMIRKLRAKPNQELTWMQVRPQHPVRKATGAETEDWIEALLAEHPEVVIEKAEREGRGGTRWTFRLNVEAK